MGYRRHEVAVRGAAELPYMELYKQSISTLGYWKALSKLMLVCGIKDFSVQDDVYGATPDRKRLQKHLSALINFAKFREEKLDGYSRLTAKTDELLQRKQEVEENLATSHQRLAALREQQQQQEPLVLQLTEETNMMEKQVQEVNVKQAVLKDEIAKLKNINGETVAQIDAHKTQLANTESDITTIRASIVENPAQMKKEIAELRDAKEHELRHIAKLEVDGEQLARKVAVIGEIERELHDCVEVMRECAEEEHSLKDATAEAKEAKAGLERTELQLQQTETKREQFDTQLRNATEKLNRVVKAGRKKEKEAQREIDKARQERAKVEGEVSENQNKLDANAKQVEKMEAKLLQLQESHAQEMSRMREQYAALEAQVRNYHAEMYAQMRAM